MRRSRTRAAFGAALATALLLASACRWGPRVERFDPATRPHGATVQLQTTQPGRWGAELRSTSPS